MTDPNTPPSDPGSGGSPEGGAPPAAPQTPEAPQQQPTDEGAAWRKMVPAEFRDDAALKDYKDFGSFVKSHVHLSQLLGREPRVPAKDAPPDAWNQFWSALGRPDTPDKYQIPIPEGEGGPEIVPEVLEGYRKAAHEAGLTGSQAHKLAEWYFGSLAEQTDTVAAEMAARNERVERELRRDPEFGGKAYDNNVRLATKFAKDFGGDELMQWLETSGEGSNPHLIRAFMKAARAMSEDRLGPSRSSNFGHTPQEARAEIGRLNLDTEFQKALHDNEHPGHRAAVERKRGLYAAAYPTEEPA